MSDNIANYLYNLYARLYAMWRRTWGPEPCLHPKVKHEIQIPNDIPTGKYVRVHRVVRCPDCGEDISFSLIVCKTISEVKEDDNANR